MNTAGDWLLAIVPIIVMVAFLSEGLIHSEILNFAAAALTGCVTYVLTMLVKPYVTGKRSLVDIDNDIKAYFRQHKKLMPSWSFHDFFVPLQPEHTLLYI